MAYKFTAECSFQVEDYKLANGMQLYWKMSYFSDNS